MSNTPQSLSEQIARDSASNIGEIDYDALDKASQIQLAEAILARYNSDTESRNSLASWAAVIVTLWLGSVLLILCYNHSRNLQLSENVLIALLGTTTLNVLGLMYIVLKGYFEKDQSFPK